MPTRKVTIVKIVMVFNIGLFVKEFLSHP